MPTIAFLTARASRLCERVAARLDAECPLLELEDARVSIEDRNATWGGRALERCDVVFVETPLVAWPQPLATVRAGELAVDTQRRGFAARERRSLHVSALRVAATRTRVVNDPARAALFAQSPAVALERLGAAGIAVRPWRIASQSSGDALRLEPTAEHGPRAASGTLALEIELASEGASAHLCLGGRAVASTKPRRELVVAPTSSDLALDVDSSERELAHRALTELGLDFACVHVSRGAVAFVDAAVDLDAWERATDGRVAPALAEWLTQAAHPRATPA